MDLYLIHNPVGLQLKNEEPFPRDESGRLLLDMDTDHLAVWKVYLFLLLMLDDYYDLKNCSHRLLLRVGKKVWSISLGIEKLTSTIFILYTTLPETN